MKRTMQAGAVIAGLCAAVALTGCVANTQKADSPGAGAETAPSEAEAGAVGANQRPNECGLQEQAGPEFSFGPYDAAIAYFQPGQMGTPAAGSTMKMLDYGESQMHLELDLKANVYGTNWGYSVDETPAGLDIAYQIADSSGSVINTGMMMQMNAIDGAHYGINLPKDTIPGPDDYEVTITIYPPKNYDLHADYITGVPISEWYKPLTVSATWKLTQDNLDIVKQNTIDPTAAMSPSESCSKYPKKVYEDPAAEKSLQAAQSATPVPMHEHEHDPGHEH